MRSDPNLRQFRYIGQPARVIFEAGALTRVDDEAALLGLQRALVLSTPGQHALAARVSMLLGTRSVGVCATAVMHVPNDVAAHAVAQAKSLAADGLIAIGGGSTVGLAKAIALDTGLPIIAIPTTYAGSEMTTVYGITSGAVKRTGKDAKVLPRTVIYDPDLTLALPSAISAVSGLNALAHAAEGLYAEDANPIMSLMAEEAIRVLASGLKRVVQAPQDRVARSDCLYGAWLCAMVLGSVGVALHHKLCHTLGGTFNLPHAETHSVILPYAIAYNAPAAPQAMAAIARALGVPDAVLGLFDLGTQLGTPRSLQALGLKVSDLDRAADLAVTNAYWNPRVVEREGVRQLLEAAFYGRVPG